MSNWNIFSGVQEVPNGVNDPIEHVYEDWNEPEWTRMLHLSTEAKSSIATEVITVFEKLDNTTPTLALHKMWNPKKGAKFWIKTWKCNIFKGENKILWISWTVIDSY